MTLASTASSLAECGSKEIEVCWYSRKRCKVLCMGKLMVKLGPEIMGVVVNGRETNGLVVVKTQMVAVFVETNSVLH